MSADGKISTPKRTQTKISGSQDFARVDALRAESDAVLVGIGTIKTDDPSLRLKSEELTAMRVECGKPPHPKRVVVDSRAEMPLDSDMFEKGLGEVVVVVSSRAPESRVCQLKEKATVIVAGDERVDLSLMLDKLYDIGVKQLMVEGGATILWSFMSQRLFDEIRIYIGALIIGGATSPTFADGAGFCEIDEFPRLKLEGVERIDDGVLLTWKKQE